MLPSDAALQNVGYRALALALPFIQAVPSFWLVFTYS